MGKAKTKTQRADYVPVQTGVRWDDDDRAIIRNLKRIFRKEGRGKMVDVLRAAIRELAARYGCLPASLRQEACYHDRSGTSRRKPQRKTA